MTTEQLNKATEIHKQICYWRQVLNEWRAVKSEGLDADLCLQSEHIEASVPASLNCELKHYVTNAVIDKATCMLKGLQEEFDRI